MVRCRMSGMMPMSSLVFFLQGLYLGCQGSAHREVRLPDFVFSRLFQALGPFDAQSERRTVAKSPIDVDKVDALSLRKGIVSEVPC